VEKGSSDGTFNEPALLQPSEAHGRRAFPVKQHDYERGVSAETGTDGAPLEGHVASSGDERLGGPRHSHLPSYRIDMERSTCGPRQRTGKTQGDAQSPGETSEHPRVSRGGRRVTTVLAHGAGLYLAGGRYLQAGAPHYAPHSQLRQ
jgi:hypothetical protein